MIKCGAMDSRIHVLITTRSGGGLILAGYQARRGAGSSNHPFRGWLDQQRSESHSSLCSRLCSSNHPFKGWLDLKDLMHRCPHGSSNHPFKGWLDPAVARVDYLHSSSNHPFKGWLDRCWVPQQCSNNVAVVLVTTRSRGGLIRYAATS